MWQKLLLLQLRTCPLCTITWHRLWKKKFWCQYLVCSPLAWITAAQCLLMENSKVCVSCSSTLFQAGCYDCYVLFLPTTWSSRILCWVHGQYRQDGTSPYFCVPPSSIMAIKKIPGLVRKKITPDHRCLVQFKWFWAQFRRACTWWGCNFGWCTFMPLSERRLFGVGP